MGVKNDRWIIQHGHEIFQPFESELVKTGISYGPGSYGYDIRLSNEFLVPPSGAIFDPKNPPGFRKVIADIFRLPPSSHVLGRSLEYVKVPRDTLVLCTGKSTYARSGLIVNITPLEPEWEGYITISLVNASSHTIFLYSGEGIAQLVFLGAEEVCERSYRDRKGKYQKQKDITPSKV